MPLILYKLQDLSINSIIYPVNEHIFLTLSETADKIRALMSDDPSQPLNLLRLAQAGDRLDGVLELDLLQRATSLLRQPEGDLKYSLSFALDAERRIIIDIEIATTLVMSCQRCLQPMQVDIKRESSLAVVADKSALEGLHKDYEPLLLSEQEKVTLIELIEDELILAIPLAPLHQATDCSASDELERIRTEGKPSPFAELAKLKKTND